MPASEAFSDSINREIIPYIKKWDEKGHFETNILKRLAELQLMGVCIPEEYGGVGMDYNTLAIICEKLERGDTAFRTAVSVHTGLNSMTLLQWGSNIFIGILLLVFKFIVTVIMGMDGGSNDEKNENERFGFYRWAVANGK